MVRELNTLIASDERLGAGQVVVDIEAAIDAAPLGNFQLRVFFLCALVAMIDGLDTQMLAFVVPDLAASWTVSPASFGPIFGAGLVGVMLGQIGLGRLSDRIGRRPVMMMSIAVFGIFSIATAWADSWWMLLVLRFITGIGLGGAPPNLIALSAEYAPARSRSFIVATVAGGFSLGAVLGGFPSIYLLEMWGWPSVFIFGGVVALLTLPLLMIALPESPSFLLRNGAPGEAVRKNLERAISSPIASGTTITTAEQSNPVRGGFLDLFGERRAPVTILLWFVFLCGMLAIYFLISWLPTLAKMRGLPTGMAIGAAMVFNVGGVIGGAAIGFIGDRIGATRALFGAYLAGAILLCMIDRAGQGSMLLLFVALAGAFTIGTLNVLTALTGAAYPTYLRGTGIGAAMGVGRLGAIMGPVVGGAMLAREWAANEVIMAVGVVLFAAAAGCLLIVTLTSRASERRLSERAS